jgi:YHS domain-containing protein
VESDGLPVDTSKLSGPALKGKKIFENKNCQKCHTLGKSMMTVVKQGKEVIVPDLTNPFIATDSSYVRTHLQFVEETDMPVVKMSNEEIRLVSRFVAELHAATHGSEVVENADTTCPVCNADVSTEKAKELGLWFTYLDETYYFECEACKKLFSEQPEVFRK